MSLSKKNKIVLFVILLGLVAGFAGYNYVMKPPTSIEDKKVDFTGDALDFIKKVRENDAEWTNKTIVVNGPTTSKDGLGIMLSGKVFCQMKEGQEFYSIKRNQNVKVKGQFIGYDDMMDELRLVECIILEY